MSFFGGRIPEILLLFHPRPFWGIAPNFVFNPRLYLEVRGRRWKRRTVCPLLPGRWPVLEVAETQSDSEVIRPPTASDYFLLSAYHQTGKNGLGTPLPLFFLFSFSSRPFLLYFSRLHQSLLFNCIPPTLCITPPFEMPPSFVLPVHFPPLIHPKTPPPGSSALHFQYIAHTESILSLRPAHLFVCLGLFLPVDSLLIP